MALSKLPQLLNFPGATSVSALAELVKLFASDVVEYVRTFPRVEFVTFDTLVTGAEYVRIEMQRPISVHVGAASGPTGAPIAVELAWQISDDTRRPGLKVTVSGSSMTPGQKHTITLCVQGRG